MDLPACGIYRTTGDIAGIPAGRLVYFHNHGDPGPGLYLPEEWHNNVAQFGRKGRTLSDLALAHTLEPLAPEGLYRVVDSFTCCQKRCRTYVVDEVVQLGYNGGAQALLFVPEWTAAGLTFPERGHPIDGDTLAHLARLTVSGQHHHSTRGRARALH